MMNQRNWSGLPRSQGEDTSHSYFLFPRHLQVPQRHHRHDKQHAVGADVQNSLCQRQVVETGRGASFQWVAWHGKNDGENEGVDDADEGDGVKSQAKVLFWVDAMVQDDEGKFGECGRPKVRDA